MSLLSNQKLTNIPEKGVATAPLADIRANMLNLDATNILLIPLL